MRVSNSKDSGICRGTARKEGEEPEEQLSGKIGGRNPTTKKGYRTLGKINSPEGIGNHPSEPFGRRTVGGGSEMTCLRMGESAVSEKL